MNASSVARIDIVVQHIASFRIDPAVLARPDRTTALIVSPAHREKLTARGREDVFDRIVVLDDFAPQAVTEAVSRLLEDGGFDPAQARLLCHDEYALGTVAQVREKLGIPGDLPASLAPFTDKLAMKAALRDSGVRMPRHTRWDADAYREDPDTYPETVARTVGLPAFVKPVNESGSVGAARLDTLDELRAWARSHTDEYVYEVDEFLRGTLYHVDTAVHDGEIVHVRVNQYLHPCHEYADGRICATFTLPDGHEHHARLTSFNRQVLDALTGKPRSGVFHHEVFVTPAGEPVFLEIAARAPAALAPATGRIRWGLDIEEAHFRLQRGEEVHAPARPGPFAAFAYFPKRAGEVVELRRPPLDSSHRWTWNVAVGDHLTDPTDIRDFAASVLFWNDDFDALQRDLERLDRHTALITR
ncbi:acetyl-CoA carboxylase biotin carboxylase subunit family protein [Streptomyces sp. NPDC014779]|uniref:ATP-grasp domain-containing protein n=1 Tax=Streptomyces sp. NPDC014779 TaxID=3364911 RepID=UPI0036FE85CE